MMTREELGLEIADAGGWEEFHQRRARNPEHRFTGEWDMYDHYKARRLRLEAEYRRRFDNAASLV